MVPSVLSGRAAYAATSRARPLSPSGILTHMDSADPVDRRPAPTSRRPRDMLISLLVLVVPLIVLIGGYQLISGRTQPVEIDPSAALAAAESGGLPVLAAADLPEGWVPISAVHQPRPAGTTVRVGYVTPGGGSAQVVQSDLPADALLGDLLPERAAPAGAVDLAGRSWQRYTAGSGEQALVWLSPQVTVLVTGVGTQEELATLAAALR